MGRIQQLVPFVVSLSNHEWIVSASDYRSQRRSVQDVVNIDNLFSSVDDIENSPITDGIFAEIRKIGSDRFVAEVVDVRGDPLGLVK